MTPSRPPLSDNERFALRVIQMNPYSNAMWEEMRSALAECMELLAPTVPARKRAVKILRKTGVRA